MTNYNLQRFLDAQESSGFGSYKQAVNEIQKGKKLSHWIWYVFPTLRQNGQDSINEKKYGLVNFEEAKAYYGHSELRERLENVSDLLLQSEMKSIGDIFGVTDSTRVKSCMTLFYIVSKNIFRCFKEIFSCKTLSANIICFEYVGTGLAHNSFSKCSSTRCFG